MIFRQPNVEEINPLLREGYKVWSKNRTFEQYYSDNIKEDAYGTRYVIENNGEIVSSVILLNLKEINEKKTYGIGSVLTPEIYVGNGYATELLKNCMKQIDEDNTLVFLYSDINPSFYERFGFRILPSPFQKYVKTPCMVRCKQGTWNELLISPTNLIPNHF